MKKVLNIIVLGLTISIGLQAQTVPLPTEVVINIEPLSEVQIPDEVMDTLTDPMNLLTPNDTLDLLVSMLLTDTNTISKIHIKLGTSFGGIELLDNTYIYDNNSLGGNLTYFREGDMLILGMGTYLNSGVFYCEIKLEDSVGNLSEIISVQSDQ